MAGKIIIPFLSQFDAAGVKQAISSVNDLGKSLGGLKGLMGGLAGAGLGSAAFNFIGESVNQAKLLQNQMMALNTVFGENNKGIEAFVANSEKLAMSNQEAAQASTFLGTNLKSAGFPMDEVVKKTEKLLKLSADLAVTYGYPVQEALTATAAMFRGEYDPIEKFGVAIKQSQVNAVLAAEGLNKLKGQQLLNASTQVRYNLLMSHSTDAQGAMIRQADTLTVKQAKLTASFKNQQAALGTALLPSITKLATYFLNLSHNLAPVLKIAFEQLNKIVNNLANGFKQIKPILDILFNVLKAIAGVAGEMALAISKNIFQFAALAGAIWGLSKVIAIIQTMRAYWTEFALAVTAGSSRLKATAIMTAEAFTFMGRSIKAAFVSNWVTALIAVAFEVGNLAAQTMEANSQLSKFADKAKEIYAQTHKNFTGFGQGAAAGAAQRSKEINEIALSLKKKHDLDVADRKAYNERLQKWQQHQKNVWQAKKAAWDAEQAANKAARDEAAKAAAAAAAQLAKDTATMKASFKKLASAFAPTDIKANLGEMEQTVVESFGKIADFLASAINNNTLTKKAAGAFKAYAAMESKALRVIAKQRDAVKGKIDLAQTLIGDVKKAVIDFGNITNALSDATNSVTTSVSYIAGKFQVLVSSSGKGAGGAKKILDNLQSVVDKAKTYAKNLQLLKKMNLATGLYDQIIQAGIDTGGATAAALVEGGQGAVSAINATFAELSKTAEGIGTTAAEVMYGQGVDLTNGLIDGLLSQDKALKTAAQTLAEAFSGAFNTTLNKTLGTGKTKVTFDKIDTSGLASGTAKQLLTNVGAAAGGANVTVTVNAGMGADGVAIGAEIVKVIKKYEKANGKVFSK